MNRSFILMSCFEGSPSCFGSGATAFKFNIYSFTWVNASHNNGPSLSVICQPVLVHTWFNCRGRGGSVALDVINEAITHQMY